MFFVYKPEGVEPLRWEFEPQKLMSPESEAIEKLTRMTFTEWLDAVARNSVTAIHALLYVLLKRKEPTLAYADVQFSMSEIAFEYDDDEKKTIRDSLIAEAARRELRADEAAFLDVLTKELPAGSDPEPDGPEPGGQVPALVDDPVIVPGEVVTPDGYAEESGEAEDGIDPKDSPAPA